MACLKPISIQVRSNPFKKAYSIAAPCGKCVNCLKDYQNMWYIRLTEEAKRHSHVLFITLTYREKSNVYGKKTVPCYVDTSSGEVYRTVNKKHCQEWLKRFRTYLSRNYKDVKFKYFLTSEYGPTTLRPHYHLLLFGVTKQQFMYAKNDWQNMFGFVSVKEVPFNDSKGAMRYVTKYCSKGQFENPLVKAGKVDKTFHLISKNIGSNYVENNKHLHLGFGIAFNNHQSRLEFIAENQNVFHNGFYYKMPRYYKEKIYGVKTLLQSQITDILLEKSVQLYNDKLAQLQPTLQGIEADCVVLRQMDADNSQTEKNNLRALGSFYQKSKL